MTDVNTLVLVKPTGEKYIFIYPSTGEGVMRLRLTLLRFAANQEFSFSEGDADVLAERAEVMG